MVDKLSKYPHTKAKLFLFYRVYCQILEKKSTNFCFLRPALKTVVCSDVIWYYCMPGNHAECSRPTKILSNLLNIDMYNNFANDLLQVRVSFFCRVNFFEKSIIYLADSGLDSTVNNALFIRCLTSYQL